MTSRRSAIGILEIETAPTVVMIDLTHLRSRRMSPIGKRSFANPHPARHDIQLREPSRSCPTGHHERVHLSVQAVQFVRWQKFSPRAW